MTEPAPADRPTIAAAIVILNGCVLMVRRRVPEGRLSWRFPGGEVEPGETAEAVAVRETAEETGVTVEAVERLGERVHPNTGHTMVYIVCEVIAGTAYVADEDELAEVAWCDRPMLTEYVPDPFHGPVQDYFDSMLT